MNYDSQDESQMQQDGQYGGDSQYQDGQYDSQYGHEGDGDESPHNYEEGDEEYEGQDGQSGYDQQGHQGHEESGDYYDRQQDGSYNHGQDTSHQHHDQGITLDATENQLRRAKRDILDNLNKTRTGYNLERFYIDLNSDLIAAEYAQFLVQAEHNIEYFRSLQKEFNVFGEMELVYTISRFEEDMDITAEIFYQEFIDLGHLLLEVESDRAVLLNPEYNHIGVGVAATAEKMILVQCFSKKMMAIQQICDGDDGIEVRGKMLTNVYGIYNVRLQNVDTRKDLAIISPEDIQFDRQSRQFIAEINCDEKIADSNKILEFYVRIKPESIEYKLKKATKEKVNLKHVELVMRCPCMIFPDPRFKSEDEKDRERQEHERYVKARAEEEARMRKEQERQARKEARRQARKRIEELRMQGQDVESLASSTQRSDRSFMSKGSFLQGRNPGETAKSNADRDHNKDDEEDKKSESKFGDDGNRESHMERSDDDDRMEFKKQSILSPEPIRDQEITNEKIMQELRQAHAEALNQKEKLMAENEELQAKIIELKRKKEGLNALERQAGTDVSGMNEHKYMNTLAHVHQIRIDLKQTQDRYNKMAAELQMKLDEKQKKCNEIKRAFIELKREVARKAAFSRTDKPIPDKMIEDWEVKEIAKNRELQALRLENLRLRNSLAKNQKILKKKEELAEGLHLIDFEQLKIENQTLNEKIEERNEDLHKLKKKNTTTVQILTHTKEKLQFETKTNAKLFEEGVELETRLELLRKDLTDGKTKRDRGRKDNQELKQKTLIFNSKSLKKDYEIMEKKITLNEDYLEYLKQKYDYMTEKVEEYTGVQANASQTNANTLNGSQKVKVPMRH